MFYYTHHSDMVAPQYVYVDVPSVYVLHWMFITHITAIRKHLGM